MGWKGYEATMPAGMLFRKMYCKNCGFKLKRHKHSNIYKKGEEGYQDTILGHATMGMDKIELVTYVYKCPNCGEIVSYEQQLKISKLQKN